MQMFLSYLYVSHTGSKRVLHPGHEVVSLLLRQALGCCEDEKTMSRSQVYSCNSERLEALVKDGHTWLAVFILLLLVVIDHDVGLD